MLTTKQRHRAIAVAPIVLMLGSGCVLTDAPPRNSKLIADYSELHRVSFREKTWVYQNPHKSVRDYSKFYVAPIGVYENPTHKVKAPAREEYDKLAETLHGLIVKRLASGHTVVDALGPGVLKIEIAVVDMKPIIKIRRPDGNVVTKYDSVLDGSKLELDCHDAETGEHVFALASVYGGKKYAAQDDPSRNANIESAFDNWSRFLLDLLNRAERGTLPPELKR